MKKLVYFHGLQSKQGGQRIDYLTKHNLVHAPQMIYKIPETWPKTLAKVQELKPQIIVGSSMGGLMSFFSGYNLNCKMLIFNPAFDRISEYINGWKCDSSQQKAQIQVVLGINDTEVDPNYTKQYLKANNINANITQLDFEHRVPFQLFTQQFQKLLQKSTQS